MSIHMTKTWFVDGKFIKQEIPESEIYKREWVGLTDEEIQTAWNSPELTLKPPTPIYKFVERIEAKLKEKNT